MVRDGKEYSCSSSKCNIVVPARGKKNSNEFPRSHYLVWWVGLRVRVKFSLGVRVSGMIRVMVDVEVRVRVSNLIIRVRTKAYPSLTVTRVHITEGTDPCG